jgi:3-hydroxyisobutyrate dehydrogenase
MEKQMSEHTTAADAEQPAYTVDNTVIGVIGLGDMGGAIAASILRGGYNLMACDVRREAVDKAVALGARPADSLDAVVQECDVALLVVVDDKQVNHIVGQLLERAGRLRFIIVSSTVMPSTVIALAETTRTKGIDLIDVPVSGGAEKAVRGLLTLFIGGAEAAVRRCWPILETFGAKLFHTGPVGAGSASKLMNNLLSMGGNALQLEAMQLGNAYGISEDAAIGFMTTSAADSRALRTWGRIDRSRRTHTLAGSPDALYDIFSKDVRTAAQAAGEQGVVLPIAAVIGATMGQKYKERDAYLEANGMTGPLLLCRICGQELGAPFRKAGAHPECLYETQSSSNS